MEDHLTPDDGFLQSVYRFHVYYQIRRILEEIHHYPMMRHGMRWKTLTTARGTRKSATNSVSPRTPISGPNQGFGPVFYYWVSRGYIKVIDVHRKAPDGEYDPKEMSFTLPTQGLITHVDYIEQENDVVSRA